MSVITYSVLISYCFALHPYEKHELIKPEWVIVGYNHNYESIGGYTCQFTGPEHFLYKPALNMGRYTCLQVQKAHTGISTCSRLEKRIYALAD